MKLPFLAFFLTVGSAMIPVSATATLPMVDGVGSYTHSQVMRHRTDADKKATPSLEAASRAYRRSLMPEYKRRAKKYGKAPAERWIAGQIRAYERQHRSGTRKR